MKVSTFSCFRMMRLFASSFHLRRSFLPALLCGLVALLVCPLARAEGGPPPPPSVAYSGVERTVYTADGASPMGVAVDSTGTVYIADAATNHVLKETPLRSGTGFNSPTVVGPSSGALSMQPVAVAVDMFFNVYIVDAAAHRVIKETWNSGSSTYAESVVTSNLTTPQAIAVDASQNIYIVDKGTEAVTLEHYVSGSYNRVLLTSITNTVTLHDPRGIVVDGSGNLFITDNGNGNLVQALYGSSVNDYTASASIQVASGSAPDPGGMAIDASHNLYITGLGTNQNEPLYLETLSSGVYTESGVATTPLGGAYGVAVDSSGNIYIADTGNNRVIEEIRGAAAYFGGVPVGGPAVTTTLLFTFSGDPMTGISPVALTQGASGPDFALASSPGTCATNLITFTYDASTGDSSHMFCSVNLTLTPAFPGARYGAVELQQISDPTITVALAYAYGRGQGPQVIFTNPLPTPTLVDNVVGGITSALEIASDSAGNLYYSINGMGVYKYNGSTVTQVTNVCGSPHGVAVDGAGNVYVADMSGSQVLKYTLLPSGSYSTATTVVGSLSSPQGVTVDGAGNVYIANTGANTVLKETLQSTGLYSQSTVAASLGAPQGVAVDGAGNVYIADTTNNQVLKEMPVDGS
jgi:sugar lactone lactonase YvrE